MQIKRYLWGLTKKREGGKYGKTGNWAEFRVKVRISVPLE